jgi:hypothetical protein
MPFNIAAKTDTQSSVGPLVIGVETTAISIPAQNADYIPESYIDLGNMNVGDSTVVTEYFAVDGINFRVYWQGSFSDVVQIPILRFHGKLFEKGMLYKITVTQTAGVGKVYPIASVLQVFNA